MKTFFGGILGGLLAVALLGASNLYYGYNSSTGNNMIPGQWIDPSPPEIITSTTHVCTWDTQHGGTNVGSFIVRSSGPCNFTFSDPPAARNSGIAGYTCLVIDTDASAYLTPFKQISNNAVDGCTVTGLTASGDHLTYIMIGYAN